MPFKVWWVQLSCTTVKPSVTETLFIFIFFLPEGSVAVSVIVGLVVPTVTGPKESGPGVSCSVG